MAVVCCQPSGLNVRELIVPEWPSRVRTHRSAANGPEWTGFATGLM
jgi:hypothetical protein